MSNMFDYIIDLLGKERVNPSRKMRKHFAVLEIKCQGYHEDEFRANAGTFLYYGLLFSHVSGVRKAQCDFHVEIHNDPREIDGANANVCFNQLVALNYLNSSRPVTNRCGLNQSMKVCNGDVVDK